MQLSSDGKTWLSWGAYATTKSYVLPAGDGLKTVWARFKDSKGVVSNVYSATITIDSTAPGNGTLTITPAPGSFTLNWQGARDAGSGIASYRLVAGNGSSPACTATPIYSGTATSFVHSGIVPNTTYYYRLCAIDNAGNSSAGATAMQKVLPEYEPPTGAVTINGGAAYTKSANVTLNLSATDASGVSQVCISNSATCTAWSSYAATKPWTLAAGDGAKTVNVWFKDILGNAGSKPYSAGIILDATAPGSGTLTITPASGSFTLNWQGASDTGSGIASYRLVTGTTSSLACSATPIYSGSATSFVHSGLVANTTYYYRLCAIDNAGNSSAGATAMQKVLPEYEPPTGAVTINGGAAYTKSANVTLNLSATDASGVSQVCISNSATCTASSSYAATKPWTLPAGEGAKSVNVWFKDALGNADSKPHSASIILDATAPGNGTLSITPAPGSFTLNWQGAIDALSGTASYRLVAGITSAPACTTTPMYSGTATSFVHSGLIPGTTYYYRLCAIDSAGNSSAGATATLKAF